ncbi:MAG: hypothetical protein ABI718_01325 [Acidobacteriota bacterium]
MAVIFCAGLVVISCNDKPAGPAMSRTPVSIRGWIEEIEPPDTELYRLRSKTAGAAEQRAEIFKQASINVAETDIASGGIGETGSFIILDVPPGKVTLSFTSPGIARSDLLMTGVPPNADILLPSVSVGRDGTKLLNPDAVVVRVPITSEDPHPHFPPVNIGGRSIPVRAVSLDDLMDRRDYPTPEPSKP